MLSQTNRQTNFILEIILMIMVHLFRTAGAYIQILWKIIVEDFIQFTIVFAIILLAFSGSFLLAIRGEGTLKLNNDTR